MPKGIIWVPMLLVPERRTFVQHGNLGWVGLPLDMTEHIGE